MEASIIDCYFYKRKRILVDESTFQEKRKKKAVHSELKRCKWQNANKMHIKCGIILLLLYISFLSPLDMLVLTYAIYFYFYNLTKYFNI